MIIFDMHDDTYRYLDPMKKKQNQHSAFVLELDTKNTHQKSLGSPINCPIYFHDTLTNRNVSHEP